MLDEALQQHRTAHTIHDGRRVVARRQGDEVAVEVYTHRGGDADLSKEPREYSETLSTEQAAARYGNAWYPGDGTEEG